jgi:hypothetical protein
MRRFLKGYVLDRHKWKILDIMWTRILSNPLNSGLSGIEIRPNLRFRGVMQNAIPSNVRFREMGRIYSV